MKLDHATRTPYAKLLAQSLATATQGGLTQSARKWRTRFAPAPTGFLHIGHVVNAIHVWGIARAYEGLVALRIEDHDRTRCRPSYETALLEDIDWLGLRADIGPTNEFRSGPTTLRQSDNVASYESRLNELNARGFIYACQCSRKDIASSAATEAGNEARYSGTCSTLGLQFLPERSRRVRVNGTVEIFEDLALGRQEQNPSEQCGDFVVLDRNGNFTYQFAVTVDDMQQDIDVVIRGEDLLQSTGRQIQLGRLLGRNRPPSFLHHPLVMRNDGIKLSKSLGDTGIREMRAAGLSAEEVLGRAAHLGGLVSEPSPVHADDLKELFL